MKIKCFLGLFLALNSVVLLAQEASFGLKAGISNAQYSLANPTQTVNSAQGYHLGAFVQLKALGLLVQPEVLINQRKGILTRNDTAGTIRLTHLDVPVLVGYSFFKVARVYAGPNFALLIDAFRKSDYKDPNFSRDLFNEAFVSGVIGAGIDFWRLTLDVRYDIAITKVGNELQTNKGNVDFAKRINTLQISLGYKLIKI
jgi:hypothetical protein